MYSTYRLKKILGLSPNKKGGQAITEAIRKAIPGGSNVLDVLTKLYTMQNGRHKPDPALKEMIAKLTGARTAWAAVLTEPDKARELVAILTQLHTLDDRKTQPPTVSIHAPEPETTEPEYPEYADETRQIPLSVLGTRPDSELGPIYGVSHTYIGNLRRKHNIPAYSAKARIDWARWDEQIRRSEMTPEGLASLIGCSVSTVRERKRLLMGTGGKYTRNGAPLAKDRTDWSTVDWSKTDVPLASKYDVSRQAVQKQRKKYQD